MILAGLYRDVWRIHCVTPLVVIYYVNIIIIIRGVPEAIISNAQVKDHWVKLGIIKKLLVCSVIFVSVSFISVYIFHLYLYVANSFHSHLL
jgi:hypothetical protein